MRENLSRFAWRRARLPELSVVHLAGTRCAGFVSNPTTEKARLA